MSVTIFILQIRSQRACRPAPLVRGVGHAPDSGRSRRGGRGKSAWDRWQRHLRGGKAHALAIQFALQLRELRGEAPVLFLLLACAFLFCFQKAGENGSGIKPGTTKTGSAAESG